HPLRRETAPRRTRSAGRTQVADPRGAPRPGRPSRGGAGGAPRPPLEGRRGRAASEAEGAPRRREGAAPPWLRRPCRAARPQGGRGLSIPTAAARARQKRSPQRRANWRAGGAGGRHESAGRAAGRPAPCKLPGPPSSSFSAGHARLNSMGPRLRPWFVPPCARDLWLELSARHARGGAIPALPIWGQRLCTCSLPPRASHFICASACSDEFQICHRICRRGRATLSAPPRAATNFSPSRKKFQLRRGLRGYTVATVRAETRPAPRAGRAGRACSAGTDTGRDGGAGGEGKQAARRPQLFPKTFQRAGGQSSPPQSS
ncbi:unnamed protein product, partial [Prorocentrum cordatum]